MHRLREAMRSGGLEPLGGEGQPVEADETYFGRKPGWQKRHGSGHKLAILSLVERSGNVRSFHIASADKDTVQTIVKANVAKEARLHTDESRLYTGADKYGVCFVKVIKLHS